MRLFGKKRERREANMNGFTASQDVALNQLTHVDQSLPTKIPKQPTLWKRVRQKWRRRDKNMNGFIDIEQNVEAKMNESTDYQDVVLNDSFPATKPKKPTLWKRLKHQCKIHDKEEKDCGNNKHSVNFEPQVTNVSLEAENNEPEVTIVSLEAENNEPEVTNVSLEAENNEPEVTNVSLEAENNEPEVTIVSLEAENNEPEVTNVSLEAENNEPEVTNVSLEAENNEPEVMNVSLETENTESEVTIVSLEAENNEPEVMNVSLEAENVEPQKRNGSFEEEPLTDAKVKAYLKSHRDFLFEYLHSHHSVLCGYVHEQVPIETLKSWLAEKKGSSLNQSEDYESEESDDSDESESESNQDELIVKPKMVGNWVVISTIGEGSCAIVSKAQNINSAEEVALKEAKNVAGIQKLRDEAAMMKLLDHKNILKFIDIVENPMLDQVFLVLEYVDGDTLKDQVALWGTFTEREAWHFMEQMASAFAYMHSHNIVHRDIKLVNILCSRGVLKVIDFGHAVSFTPGENIIAFGGTPGYMAPEVSEFEFEGPPADVWALGIVFTKLFLGLQFNGHDIIKVSPDTYDFIVVYSPPPSASEALVSLLTGMLLIGPSERFTMQEIVNHTWFEENRPMEF